MRLIFPLMFSLASMPALAHAPAASVPEQEAQSLIARWQKAQNDGKFSDYEKLYARSFTGVRRSGSTVRHFDRKGWMKDRERMFRSRMELGVAKLKVLRAAKLASVSFEQSFDQGTYHDRGPKRIDLVREGSELRIAREEMLRSMKREHIAASDERWRITPDGLLLDAQPLEDPEAPIENDGAGLLAKTVAVSELSPKTKDYAGKTLKAWDFQGKFCSFRPVSFRVAGVASGDRWAITPEGSDEDPSQVLWQAALGHSVGLYANAENCAIKWGVAAIGGAAPDLAAPQSPSESLLSVGRKAFEALPEDGKLQAQSNSGRWAEPEFLEFEFKSAHLLLGKAFNDPQCGREGVSGSVIAVWQVTGTAGKPGLKLYSKGTAPFGEIRGMVRWPNEKTFELYYGDPGSHGYATVTPEGIKYLDEITATWLGCGCGC